MKTFNNAIDWIANFESFRPYAYPDPESTLAKATPNCKWGFELATNILHSLPPGIATLSGDPWTAGFGRTSNVTSDTTCNENDELTWLNFAIKNIGLKIMGMLENKTFTLTTFQNMALSDYAYNCGINAFPTLIVYLKAGGNIQGAALEFLNGFYSKGRPVLGLLLRRISEYNTFLTGQYLAFEEGDPISQQMKDNLLKMNASNQAGLNMINSLKIQG